MTTPHAAASTGTKARDEITNILRRFGCESIGFERQTSEHVDGVERENFGNRC
jgi:hypothetical protein